MHQTRFAPSRFARSRIAPSRRPVLLGSAITIVLGLIGAISVPSAASAVQSSHPTLVSTVPPTFTPNIDPNEAGVVYAIAKVGTTIYAGGEFTSVSPHNSPGNVTTVTNITAFAASNGAILTTFKPTVDGDINAITPGPTPGTVYIGGSFKTVDGVASHVALVNATTGAIAPGWTSPKSDGAVNRLLLADGQLFVGGNFTTIGGQSRRGLATVNPTTGGVTTYSTLSFTGHHNYMVNCTTGTCANGAVGVKAFDVTPDGTRMIVLGNFTDVSGTTRDQVAMIDLGATSAVVDPSWNSASFTSSCVATRFDSYVRDVQFSPDGSYFAVVSTGAGGVTATNTDGTRAICDAVARFDTSATGTDVQPTWVDWTGNDSFWSVAVSGAAIYAGGHNRWINNGHGTDAAQEGAVPRPGVVAVDPQNGLPFAWNPGRNPRGQGAYALLATSDGLYVGSDTDYFGNFQYNRAKIGYFPLAGGEVPPANIQGTLPGTVYLFGPQSNTSAIRPVTWDGASTPTVGADLTGFNASTVRSAFDVDGNLFYWASGGLWKASFQDGVVGAPTAVDPYNDPVWSNVSTGSNGGTYRGSSSNIYSELPTLTSMFYSGGRIYYTLAGKSQLFYRYFETDDGVTGSEEYTTSDTNNWSAVAGAFVSGNTMYFASSTTGNLMSVPFLNGQPTGTPVVADASTNWRNHGAVVLSSAPANQPPTAAFTVNCPTPGGACTADGSASADPDGTIATYSWSWGDGQTTQTTTPTTSHAYSASGTYSVTLTVTDNRGATGIASHSVDYTATSSLPISFRAATATDVSASTVSVTVPSAVQSGDEMLLYETYASTSISTSAPAGWTQVGKTTTSNLTSVVYSRRAAAGDAGTAAAVTLSASVKASLTLAAYANASDPVEAIKAQADTNTASHVSPTVSGLTSGSRALTYWSDKATTNTAWTAPGTVTPRSTVYGSGGGAVSALLAESPGSVAGTYGGLAATSSVTSGSGISWTIGLANQLT